MANEPETPPESAPAGSSPPRPPRWVWSLALALVVFAFVWPAFSVPGGIASTDEYRNNDWLNTRSFDLFSRHALLDHGQFPLRSHLVGGGFPTIAHPSDGSWAPTLLPTLLLGDVLGVKVVILLFWLLGAWGVRGLARDWLELSDGAALFAASLFAVAGWAPSMLLVGFYNQVFFLLSPALLHLLLSSPGRPARLLLAGGLYAMVLQQGQHAFPVIGFFAALLLWLQAAAESGPSDPGPVAWLRRWGLPLLVGLLLTASPAVDAHVRGPWVTLAGWAVAVAVVVASSRMRDHVRSFLPWAGRLLGLLAVACGLGLARLVGLAAIGGSTRYPHVLQRHDALWFPSPYPPPIDEERFYRSPLELLDGLLGRVPAEMQYVTAWGREGAPATPEYAWLGLTAVGLTLAVVGLVLALRDRRSGVLALACLLVTAVCFGPNLPPDLHFLLTWGVPPLQDLAQPIKYWNFLVLLTAVLLAGLACDELTRRVPKGLLRRLAWTALAASLLLPFLQNRAALGETFAVARPAPPAEPFHGVSQIAEPWWVELPDERLRAMSDELFLREKVRARQATEYFNIRRGVATHDWYGSLLLPEHAVPKRYVTLAGEVIDNPRYRGEAWVEQGEGRVHSVEVRPNSVAVDVTLDEAAVVVVNQNHLDGFLSSTGRLHDRRGLLAVDLPAGRHDLKLTYRPTLLIAGLFGSALASLLWFIALVTLWRRGRAQLPPG